MVAGVISKSVLIVDVSASSFSPLTCSHNSSGREEMCEQVSGYVYFSYPFNWIIEGKL